MGNPYYIPTPSYADVANNLLTVYRDNQDRKAATEQQSLVNYDRTRRLGMAEESLGLQQRAEQRAITEEQRLTGLKSVKGEALAGQYDPANPVPMYEMYRNAGKALLDKNGANYNPEAGSAYLEQADKGFMEHASAIQKIDPEGAATVYNRYMGTNFKYLGKEKDLDKYADENSGLMRFFRDGVEAKTSPIGKKPATGGGYDFEKDVTAEGSRAWKRAKDVAAKSGALEGPLLPLKERQRREIERPRVTAAYKEVINRNKQLRADLLALKNHEGLDGITGIVGGRTPGVYAESRAAQTLYDKIIARGGFSELVSLKNSGVSLAPISNTEMETSQRSFATLGRTQEKKDLQNAIDKTILELEGMDSRITAAYEDTYEHRNGTGKGAGNGEVDLTNPLFQHEAK
jgi:hypothetical protein